MNSLIVKGVVDAEVQALIDEVTLILDNMNTAFRKEDRLVVLQLYDVMINTPQVLELARRVMEVRPECQLLEAEELSVNVLEPTFVVRRVQQLSPRYLQEKKRILAIQSGSSTNNSSRAVSPGSLNNLQRNPLGGAVVTSDSAANSTSGEGGGDVVSFGNATYVSATAKALYDIERRLEHAAALGLLTAQEQAPDEEDHHLEMLEDFEVKFSRPSELLRAVRGRSRTALEVCETYRSNEGNPTPDVLLAALLLHPLRSTDEVAQFVAFTKENGVPITMQVAETLEKCYVKCMKEEGAEKVFHRMTHEVGLVPLTTRPFAMVFNSPKLTMAKSVLDYYELMLDYGIAPEPSLLRILCKQSSGMEYASLHFTLRLKSYEQQQQQQQQQQNAEVPSSSDAGGGNGVSGAGTAHSGPPPDSRRKNERVYFQKRLMDMAEQSQGTAPLMEAMKVVHRAEVEGTQLDGDTLILTALLRWFCNGTTPVEDLVKPFSASMAYRPGKIDSGAALEAAAAAEEERRRASDAVGGGGIGGGRFTEVNAFDFGLEDANLETLAEISAKEKGELPGGMSGMGGMGGGAAALLMGLEEEGLLDGGLEDDDVLAGISGDRDLEEIAHRRLRQRGGGGATDTASANHHHHHHDPLMPIGGDDDDDDDDDDSLDDEPQEGATATNSHVKDKASWSADKTGGASAATEAAAVTATGATTVPAASSLERSRRTPRHIPGIASPSEEAAYVLDVLASYGSYPDNNLLSILAKQYMKRGNGGIGVVQQVAQVLFKAGHESRGAVEAVRSSSCHCLVRYYIRRHQRSKLTQLVRCFVEQCYEYNHLFNVSWAGDLDPRNTNYHLRNSITFSAFATAAMKAGPLDWALGLLALALCMSSHSITDNTKARLCQMCDGESYNSPHRSMIDTFDECGWDRDRILANEYYMEGGGANPSGDANERGDHHAEHGNNNKPHGGQHPNNASSGKTDIYSTSIKEAQQISSFGNPRSGIHSNSLETCMHGALREMNLGRDVIDYFKKRLRAEKEEAAERVRKQEKSLPITASHQQPKEHSHHRGNRR